MAKLCPSCGYTSEDHSKFCIQCGAPLNDSAAPPQPEEPSVPVPPVIRETPVYSVNNVSPAESHYTYPTQPERQPSYSGVPQTDEPTYTAPPARRKKTGLLIVLSVLIVAVIGVVGVLGYTQGWFSFDNRQLDGEYRLTGFISEGKDYSASVGTLGDDYSMTVSGGDCVLQLGEGNRIPYHMDHAKGTLSNNSSQMTFTVSETGGVPSISIVSDDTVFTFTRE